MNDIDFKQAVPVPENFLQIKEVVARLAVLGETYLYNHDVVCKEFVGLIEQLYKRLILLEAVYVDGRQDGFISATKIQNKMDD